MAASPYAVPTAAARKNRVKKFRPIVSPLDPADHRSGVHTSEFRGLYNLAMIGGGALHTHGLLEVLSTFAWQALYVYTALIPVYLAGTQWFSGRQLISTVHHTLQSLLFFFAAVCIVSCDWNTIHAVSAFVEGVVLLMKRHSYVRTKLELFRSSGSPPVAIIKDFTMYLLYPTLVYEPKYPRTERIRWGYVIEKLLAVIFAISMLYFIVTDHVMPRLEASGLENPVLVITRLLLPFLGCYLLTWFITFECICNGIAELTFLADRDFYDDWWNSTTFDEFARKWNKPVHEFLLRHVYLESLESYKLSKRHTITLTFLVSAALHECVFVIMFRAVKMYFFLLQMLQVVIIIYGRGLRGSRLGNFIFWFGMILGLPLQAVIYSREYHGGEPIFMDVVVPTMLFGFGGALVASLVYVRPVKK